MLSIQFLFFIVIFVRVAWTTDSSDSEDKDDKLVLKPAQLIDLILDERLKTGEITVSIKSYDEIDKLDIDTKTEESIDDGETLKSRKVWSRWSKWGPCSVSCGLGVITRLRACVAGRCARGEREEQRRICRLSPCVQHEPNDLE